MPGDTSSSVEILLRIRSEGQAALAELQAKLDALKVSGVESMAAIGTSSVQAEKGFSSIGKAATGSADAVTQSKAAIASHADLMSVWSSQLGKTDKSLIDFGGSTVKLGTLNDRLSQTLLQAALASKGVEGSIQSLAAAGSVAAAPVVALGAAVAKGGIETEKAAVNAATLERGLLQMGAGASRAVPQFSALGQEVRLVGTGAIAVSGELGILGTVLAGGAIIGLVAFAAAVMAATSASASFISQGIKLNEELETTKTQLAGTFQQFDPAIKNFDQALSVAGEAMTLVSEKAREHGISETALAGSLAKTTAILSNAGVSFRNQINLVTQLSVAQRALGISNQQLVQEVNQIFDGHVRVNNVLAQRLDLNAKEVQALRESGQLYDVVSQGLVKYAEAGEALRNASLDGQMDRVKAAMEQLAIEAAKPFLQPLTDAARSLADTLSSPSLAAGFASVIGWIKQVGSAALTAAVDIATLESGLGSLGAVIGFIGKGTAPLGGPPGLQDKINAAADNAEFGKGGYGGYGDSARMPRAAYASDFAKAPDTELDRQLVIGAPSGGVKGGGGGGGGGGKGPSQDTEDQQKITEIQSELNSKAEEYKSLLEQANAAHKLGLTTLSQEKDANLATTNAYIGQVDASIAKLQQMKDHVNAVGEAQGGLNTKEQTQINNLDKAIAKMQLFKAQAQIQNQDNSFWGQWNKDLITFSDSLQLTGQKAAATFTGSINSAIGSTSQALTGLITGTKNWQQAFTQAGDSIIQSIIKVGLQWAVGQALQKAAVLASILMSAGQGAAGAEASASEIPFVGWMIGPAAGAAALAEITAFGAGFAVGGIIGGSPSNSDNTIARVASGEGIISSRAVQHYGADTIHAMNAMTFAPSFATGGVVGNFGSQGGGGTASRDVNVHNYFDRGEMIQHILGHPDAEHMVVDIIRKNRYQIKI